VAAVLVDVRGNEETPDLAAYAFTPGGGLIDRAPLKDDKATLSIPTREEPQSVRLVVGPLVEAAEREDLAELLRLRASERFVRIEPGALETKVEFRLPRPGWLCWLIGRCSVRGTLLKRVTSGGVPIDLPVCDAEVEIYEVDPIPVLVPRIPIELLERLREIVRFPLPPFPPPPPPDGLFRPPRPEPDPSPIDELLAESQLALGSFAPDVTPAPLAGDFVTHSELAQLAEERFSQRETLADEAEPEAERTVALIPETPEPPDRAQAFAVIRSLAESSDIRLAASQGLQPFRDALVRNPVLVRPLLCILFPPLVTTQLVATATTDDCGRFSAVFSQGCSSDTPDLYFVAYRRVWVFRVPIYRPLPIACNTYWEYACGTEVTLYTSSPFAYTCPPCRPVVAGQHWVLVMAIGNTPLSRIHGTGASLVTTSSNVGLTDAGAPFGGLVRLRLEFDSSLRDDLNVRYYRVSWKRAGTNNPFVPLDLEVHRHYTHVVGTTLVLEAYPLGPRAVGTQAALYEIPPALPPIGQWTIPDAVEDTTSAKFPTGGSRAPFGLVPPSAAGIYKLRVELFDAGGNPVNIGALGIHFVVPTSTDLSGTIHTTEAAGLGLVPGPPVDTGNAFVMRLHVDNNPTFAQIAAQRLNGSVAADACGVIRYTLTPGTPPPPPTPAGSVTLAYIASHPNGFATRTFDLKRGATPVTVSPLTASGAPVGAGSYSATPAVSTLLSPGCAVAGFAESLNVYGTATDGWGRLGYDASDLRAFVLAPPP
jgi:hypothetical protein